MFILISAIFSAGTIPSGGSGPLRPIQWMWPLLVTLWEGPTWPHVLVDESLGHTVQATCLSSLLSGFGPFRLFQKAG